MHFVIDGATAKTKRVLCLAYDEVTGSYYDFKDDGKLLKLEKANESKL